MKSIAIHMIILAAIAMPSLKQHSLQLVKRSTTTAPFFYPSTTMKSNRNIGEAFRELSLDEKLDLAITTIAKEASVKKSELKVSSHFTDSAGITHVYLDRTFKGIPISNHNAAVHIKNGQVSSYFTSFQGSNSLRSIYPASDRITVEKAVEIAEKELGIPKDSTTPYQSYLQINQDTIVHAHMFQLRDDRKRKWMHVAVDAESGQIVEVVDYYSSYSYKAIKFPKNFPTEGFEMMKDPADSDASPTGWNQIKNEPYNVTKGNNVDVFISSTEERGNSTDGIFYSEWNATEDASTSANKQASAVNLFYVINKLHDIMYHYGFTEAAGNFQQNNFDKGGEGNDSIQANDQAPYGFNNADFASPPDGQPGKMNMYIFTMTTPQRDGSLSSDIPIHEFTHGVSNRLTGGAKNSRCLQIPESSGMGEGWSDTVAMYILWKPTDDRNSSFSTGNYVLNTPGAHGIRRYNYTTDMNINPETFSLFKNDSEPHRIGDIWATMLNEVYWNLVDKYGYSEDWYNAKQIKGNIIAMQLVIGGLMLQPCNPTFTQARDAILQADVNYYKGSNQCELWKAFAKRGLGIDANQTSYTDGFKIPVECSGQ